MLFAAISGGSRRTLSSETPRPAALAGRDTATAAADSIPDPRSQRVLHAAVAGLPNAGKSTLLNYMVGDKVSTAMTRRVRRGLRGNASSASSSGSFGEPSCCNTENHARKPFVNTP